jgi:hypothetical protein
LLQFVATVIDGSCSAFQSGAVRFSLSSRTINPKVAGSIPARPTTKYLQIGDSFIAIFEGNDPWVNFRLLTQPSTPETARTSASERET